MPVSELKIVGVWGETDRIVLCVPDEMAQVETKNVKWSGGLWCAIFALTILLWFFRQYSGYCKVGLDVSVFLGCARELLEGHKMFSELFEINPPLISYISILPQMMSTGLNLKPVLAVITFTLSIAVTSLSLSLWALAKVPEQWNYCGTIISAFFACLIFILPHEFGQREELFVMVYLPFFLLRWLSCTDRSSGFAHAILTGVLAGLGCSIKPVFFALFIAVELMLYLRTRRLQILKPEMVAFISAVAVYVGHFMLWEPVRLSFFVTKHIPSVWANYRYSDNPWPTILLLEHIPAGLPVLLVSLLWAVAWWKRHDLVPLLFAWILGTYLIFVLQHKGWDYHAMPLLCGVSMLDGLLLALTLEALCRLKCIKTKLNTLPSQLADRCFLAVQVMMIAGLIATCVVTRKSPKYGGVDTDLKPVDQWMSQYTKPGDVVAVIAFDARRVENLMLSHRLKSGWRYAWGYPIFFCNYQEWEGKDREGATATRIKFLETIPQDIETRKPKAIIFDGGLIHRLKQFRLWKRSIAGYEKIDTQTVLSTTLAIKERFTLYVKKQSQTSG